MIKIQVNHEMFAYDMYHITKAFYPDEMLNQEKDSISSDAVRIEIASGEGMSHVFFVEEEELHPFTDRKEKKQQLNIRLYDYLAQVTKKKVAWGTLTGIRPTKLMMSLYEQGMSEPDVTEYMQSHYRVTKEKAELGMEIAKREKTLLERLDCVDGYSLYVGIPFCPTTCSYCSFTSYPIAAWQDHVDGYLDALSKELQYVADVSAGKKLNTIYIGGGTPTTLTPAQSDRLLTVLEKAFSYDNLLEMTVEAGRPDSITREKLEVLKAHGIGRISINPQTMQQKTLDRIGRHHTIEDVLRVYELARQLGFDNINMDLIAGLPGEHLNDMEDTLKQIYRLAPDSLTVHALAMKRASRMMREKKEQAVDTETARAEELSAMICMAADYANDMDLVPYYMYRQKNIAGNFENVGYAKVDKAGIYNILIMEEKQTIIAAGAGATTKVVLPMELCPKDEKTGEPKRIARVENVKDVGQYVARVDEMIERKGEWLWC